MLDVSAAGRKLKVRMFYPLWNAECVKDSAYAPGTKLFEGVLTCGCV